MRLLADPITVRLLVIVTALLVASTVVTLVAQVVRPHAAITREMRSRVTSWWVMATMFAAVTAVGRPAMLGLFFAVSWISLRELVIALDFRPSDRATLLFATWVVLPGVYVGVALGYVVVAVTCVPLAVILAVVASASRSGPEGLASRLGLSLLATFVAVVGVACIPALATQRGVNAADGIHLLLFLSVITQVGDCGQWLSGKLFGHTPLAPAISPRKTREGLVGGVLIAAGLGAALSFLLPVGIAAAAGLAAGIALTGTAGDLLPSAIKRDAGIKDFSALIPGHGGMLDRVDSLTLAAPAFLLLTRLIGA